jgi:hypothetical protein
MQKDVGEPMKSKKIKTVRWALLAFVLLMPMFFIFSILYQYMHIKSRMGRWDVAVIGKDGKNLGSGKVDYKADHWEISWSSTIPFLIITPQMTKDSGELHLSDAGIDEFNVYDDKFEGDEYVFSDTSYFWLSDGIFAELFDNKGNQLGVTLGLKGNAKSYTGTFSGHHHEDSWEIPITASFTRPAQ